MTKWVIAWIVALLLGAAMGWRGEIEGPEEVALERPEPAGEATANRELRAAKRGAEAFGGEWRYWADRVRQAETSVELEGLFHTAASLEDPMLQATMRRLLGVRWAEVDPEAGARFLPPGGAGMWTLVEMMTEWVLLDPVAGLKGLEAYLEGSGSQVADEVEARLIARDPKAALAMIRGLGRYSSRPKQAGLKTLAAAYPEELAALIIEIETERLASGGRYRADDYIEALAAEMVERDPRAAKDWADQLEGKMRETARREVIERWADADPKAMLRYLEEQGEEHGHPDRQRMENLLAGDDIDEVIKVAKTRGSADRSLSPVLARKIAQGEMTFEQVYDRVAGIETNGGWVRYALMRGLWSGMSEEGLSDALEVLKSKPAGGGRKTAMEGLLRTWVSRDPHAAAAAIAAVPAGEARDTMAGSLLAWSELKYNGEGVKAAVAALPVADRAAAIGGLLEVEQPREVPAGFDPRYFAETLAGVPNNEARALAVERLAKLWGGVDPGWAMEWATGLAGEESVRAVAGVARGWAPHDLFSLSNALLEIPEGAVRDSATGVMVEALTKTEPGSAWEWAQRLEDPEARQRVVEAWVEDDPVAAKQAVDAADLPTAELEALRAVLLP